jgi:hypothetical protein
MPQTQAIEQLKKDWTAAKKAADSLSADFRTIEAARERAAEARRLYFEALEATRVNSEEPSFVP